MISTASSIRPERVIAGTQKCSNSEASAAPIQAAKVSRPLEITSIAAN